MHAFRDCSKILTFNYSYSSNERGGEKTRILIMKMSVPVNCVNIVIWS